MTEETPVNRRLIYDTPAQTDAFCGGGHARTAKALAKLIREFDAETRAIGLEGRWGSGKSSIIEMSKKILEENADQKNKKDRRYYHIFTYDLWAHQTGNFHRTVLEQIISWTKAQPYSNKEGLDAIHDEITNRTIITTTVNTKTFSVFGIIALLFLFSLPLIYIWLSPFAFFAASNSDNIFSNYAKIALIFMISLTIIQICINWWRGSALGTPTQLVKRLWYGERPPKVDRPSSLLSAVSKTLSLFSKDADITNITQRVREIDPSQHEFEKTFKEIISLYQTVERRIIIVFDNIDRLPAEQIKDAWSNVRAIVSSVRPSDGLERKITLIIPYDRQHILNALQDIKEDNLTKEDILRKSFDATLFVSPPVIADASEFFELKLKDALGNQFDKESGYRVYKIFDLSCGSNLPTPRQIIAFINAVTGLWEEWQGRIALPTIALFMTYREKLAHDPGVLRRPDEIGERQRDLADDVDLFKHLAALAYNVEPDYAFQVLLHGPMEALFTGNNTEEEINHIVESPGWNTILPDIYRENAPIWAKTSILLFRNSVRSIVILNASSSIKLECKRALLDAIRELTAAPSGSWEHHQEDLIRLFDLSDVEEGRNLTMELVDWLHRSLPNSQERTFADGQHWIIFIGELYQKLVETYGDENASEIVATVPFPSESEFLVGVASNTHRTDLHLKNFENVPRSKHLIRAMESRLIEKPTEFCHAWPEVRHLLDKGHAATFAETLGNHLRDNMVDDVDALLFLLKSYNRLISDSIITEALTESRRALVNNGALYHHIDTIRKSESEGTDEALAAVFWLILSQTKGKVPAVPDLQSHTFGNLNVTRDWVHSAITDGKIERGLLIQVAALVQQHCRLSVWIDWAASTPAETGFLRKVIVEIVKEGEYDPPSPAIIAKRYMFLKALLITDNFNRLLERAGSYANPEEWSELDPEKLPISLIADNAERKEEGWLTLYEKIDQWLKGQSSDALKQSLFDETEIVLILRQRTQDAGLTLAPEKLKTAITEHILAIFSGDLQSKLRFDAVWNAVPPNSRRGLATDILDHLERTVVTSSGVEVALACYPSLMSQLPLAKRADVAVRKIILRLVEAAQKGADSALTFLEANKTQIRQAMKKVSDDPSIVGEFHEYLEQPLSNEEEQPMPRSRAIYRILGIPAPSRPSDEADGAHKAQGDAAK